MQKGLAQRAAMARWTLPGIHRCISPIAKSAVGRRLEWEDVHDPGKRLVHRSSSGAADGDPVGRRGRGVCARSAENGHCDLAAMLLEAGSDPNDQRSGFTALHALSWVRTPNRGDHRRPRSWQNHPRKFDPSDPACQGSEVPAVRSHWKGGEAAH